MGHVTKRHGRPGWHGFYRDGQGKRRRVRLPGTRREAEAALRKLETASWQERKGVADPAGDLEIAELRGAWQAHIQTRRRPRTWECYELGLREVLGWLASRAEALRERPPLMVGDLTVALLEAFAAAKLEAGAAHRTTQMRCGALVQMCRWGAEQGLIGENPLARWKRLTGPKRRQRGSLTEFEMAKLLQGSPQPFRDIWRVFLGTGLRAGELTALEWSDVQFEQAELHVRAETSKGQRGRTIPLRQDLLGILRRLRLEVPQRMHKVALRVEECEAALARATHKAARECAERRLAQARRAVDTAERLVFCNGGGGPWGDNLARRLKPCLAAAGLPQRIDVHTLRHTFGSHLVRAGVDVKTVQELMGHSSAMVTLDIYAHGFGDRKAAAVELIPLSGQGHVQVAAPNPRPKALGT